MSKPDEGSVRIEANPKGVRVDVSGHNVNIAMSPNAMRSVARGLREAGQGMVDLIGDKGKNKLYRAADRLDEAASGAVTQGSPSIITPPPAGTAPQPIPTTAFAHPGRQEPPMASVVTSPADEPFDPGNRMHKGESGGGYGVDGGHSGGRLPPNLPPQPPIPPPPHTGDFMDSGDWGDHSKARHNDRWRRHEERKARTKGDKDERLITPGGVALFLVGFFLLNWLWVIIGVILAIAPLLEFVGRTLMASVSSFYFLCNLPGGIFDPKYFRKDGRGTRLSKAMAGDWAKAAQALGRAVYQFSRPWGLGRITKAIGRRITDLTDDSPSRYMSTAATPEHTPTDFRDSYHVVDQLQSGGSSARVYVVRKAGGDPDKLFVLKYFDLATGARLESVVRETQAVELARRLGLIVDSKLGERSFWYVMPYYRGEVLTRRVLDEFVEPDKQKAGGAHYQWLSLAWTHQLLQLISQYHEAGVFHKDIKPDNLIVSGEYLYLVDIGLMTPLESVQQLTTHGTEYFRDPEMVKLALAGMAVRDVDAAKFDIYAVGAVLYFLFEGNFPASGSLSKFSRKVPRAVQMVVSRALAPFERRYSDARQMLADVDYLCWAASQGKLDSLKPAELPSFRAEAPIDEAASESATIVPALAAAAHPPAYAPSPARQKASLTGAFVTGVLLLVGLSVLGVCIVFAAMIFSGRQQKVVTNEPAPVQPKVLPAK